MRPRFRASTDLLVSSFRRERHAFQLELDLLEWIGPDGRSYQEAMDAWRTSGPRLSM